MQASEVIKRARHEAFVSDDPMVDAGIRSVLADLHEFMINQDLWAEARDNGRAEIYDFITALRAELPAESRTDG